MSSSRTPRRPVRADADAGRIAENRDRQRALYGAPLGERIRLLTAVLGITQARLAETLGMSGAMLSQLASGRRCKIGDPDVLARLQSLDERCAGLVGVPTPDAVALLLVDVSRVRWRRAVAPGGLPTTGSTGGGRAPAAPAGPFRGPPTGARPRSASVGPPAVEALRRIAAPARLAAAAATLGPGFPELAEVLRQAAGRA